jgi:hypothetical protein
MWRGSKSFRSQCITETGRSQVNCSQDLEIEIEEKCYHIQALRDLHEVNYPRRTANCADLVEQIQN